MSVQSTEGASFGTPLFRIVDSDPPNAKEFLSQFALHRVPRRPLPPHLARLWDGVSVYDSERRARSQARRLPRLGKFIAELRIPPESPLRWEQTTDDPKYFTVWGDPSDILGCVIRVTPVERHDGT